MNERRSLSLGRAVLLSLAYVALGILLLAFSLAGHRFWTGLGAFFVMTWVFQVHVSLRSWGELGLPFRVKGVAEAALGALLGFGLFSFVTLILWVTRSVTFQPSHTQGANGEIVVALAVGSLLEEMFFRGFPLLQLTRALGAFRALILTSFLFGLVHLTNPSAGLLPFLGVFAAGCLMGAIYLRWRSLWASWGFHFAWNAVQGLLYGFPISGLSQQGTPEFNLSPVWSATVHGPAWWTGGGFGPEGSLLTVLTLGLLAMLLIRPPEGPTLEEVDEQIEMDFRRIYSSRSPAWPESEPSESISDDTIS